MQIAEPPRDRGDRGRRAGPRGALPRPGGAGRSGRSAASASIRARTSARTATPARSRARTRSWSHVSGSSATMDGRASTSTTRSGPANGSTPSRRRSSGPSSRTWPTGRHARRRHARRYSELLAGTNLVLPTEDPEDEHVFHLYVVRSERRDALLAHLVASGVGAGIHYPVPLHRQRAYRDLPEVHLPATELAASQVLSLPMFPELERRADRARRRRGGAVRSVTVNLAIDRPGLLGSQPGSQPGDPGRGDPAHDVRRAARSASSSSSANTRASRTTTDFESVLADDAVDARRPGDARRQSLRPRQAGARCRQARPGREAAGADERANVAISSSAPLADDLTLMVGHVFLFNAAVRRMKEYIDSGELGDVHYIYSQRLNLGQVRHGRQRPVELRAARPVDPDVLAWTPTPSGSSPAATRTSSPTSRTSCS